jgi:hypothetical protein
MIDLDGEVELLVLDVFGAACLRTVARPADVFAFAAREFAWRYSLSPAGLAKARREAERRARARGKRSTLEQIYSRLKLGKSVARDALRTAEEDVEEALAAAHPAALALVARARERALPVAFVDEGPLPPERIERILRRAGYAAPRVFPSLEAAREAHRVEPGRTVYVAGEPRSIEASGLDEAESLFRGLLRLYELRTQHAPEGAPAASETAARAFIAEFGAARAQFPWLMARPHPAETITARS